MAKKILKGSASALAALLVLVQFVRPEKNIAPVPPENDITAQYPVQPDIHAILRNSCYDCHSNSTRYPWYAEVQPVGWWLNSHIMDAKRELNFSEFAGRPRRWQYRKFEEIAEQIEKGTMPLPSYLFAHADARLSEQQKAQLISWAQEMKQHLQDTQAEGHLEQRD